MQELPKVTNPKPGQEETREKLLRAALEEFAKHGVQAVPLSRIRQAANQANRSVVHYHFKDKDTLVEAVTERVSNGLQKYMQQTLAQYDERKYQSPADLADLVRLMFMPFWNYYFEDAEGKLGLQFFSRMTWQTGELGQALLRQFFKTYFQHFALALMHTVPHLDPAEVQLRIYMGVNTAIHGLADMGIILQDESLRPLFSRQDSLERMQGLWVGYLAGGIGAALSGKPDKPG